MTVSVRPGKPNAAASGFLSGIIREPLAGLDAVCPVAPETAVALSSPARTIDGLIAVFEADRERFGGRTALNLPALTVRVDQMIEALRTVAGDDAVARVKLHPRRRRRPHGRRLAGAFRVRNGRSALRCSPTPISSASCVSTCRNIRRR